MSDYYIITFTPLSRFFFGSSDSWGESFYAKSLRFPTQTTILGCLRRILLKQNNMLDVNMRYPKKDTNYKDLTGTSPAKGFDEVDLNLGIINKVSPVFISKLKNNEIDEILFSLPSDVYKSDDGKLRIVKYKKDDTVTTSRSNDFSYKKVTAGKTYPAEILGNKETWELYSNSREINYNPEYEMDKIIIPTDQPGIAREDRNKKKGEFYRKKDFMLADGYSFGVVVEAEVEIISRLKRDLVFVGGEQSKFIIEISEINEDTKQKFPTGFSKFFISNEPIPNKLSSTAKKIVFLSHLINNVKPIGIEHSIIEKMESIRSLNESGHKTYSFRAVPSGSVFYTNKNFSMTNNYKFPTKIGYNFFIEFNQEI